MSAHSPDHDPYSARRLVFWTILVANVLAYGLGVAGFYQYEKNLHQSSRTHAVQSGNANQTPGPTAPGTARADSTGAENSHGTNALTTAAMFRNACYHALQLFILHTPHLEGKVPTTLDFARWVAPLTFGTAAVFAFWRKLRRQFRRLVLMGKKHHTIICGLGEKGLELVYCHRGLHTGLASSAPKEPSARRLTRRERRVVVIEQNPQNPLISSAEDAGAVVLIGSMTEESILREARVKTAKRLVAVCGDDGTNVEVATLVQKFFRAHARKLDYPLHCVVHMTNLNLLTAFQRANITTSTITGCRLTYFDIYEFSARQLLEAWPLGPTPANGAKQRGTRIIILGFGRMGRAVAAKASETAMAKTLNLELHVFDRRAADKPERFTLRFKTAKDRRTEFYPGEVDSTSVMEKVKELCHDSNFRSMVVLTTDSDVLNTELALRLLEELKDLDVRFGVRLSSKHGLAELFADGLPSDPNRERLRAFGMIRDSCCDKAYVDD